MRLVFLGTCSGTEPVRGFRHVSFSLEHSGRVYFFDAGEGSSYTAHILGIDLLKTEAVFISHCHMDHIGGLPNLLWNINKLDIISGETPPPMTGKKIDVFIPNEESWSGVEKILRGTEGGFNAKFKTRMNLPSGGEIFKKNGLSVSALPNTHLGKDGKGRDLSFSYRIDAGGKSIVYSGDVRNASELEPLINDCSLILMETGHHKVEDICSLIREKAPLAASLGFIHHGRAVLADPQKELEKARSVLGDRVFIARDGMALEIQPEGGKNIIP